MSHQPVQPRPAPEQPEMGRVEPPSTRQPEIPEGMRRWPEMVVPGPDWVQSQDPPSRTPEPDELDHPGRPRF